MKPNDRIPSFGQMIRLALGDTIAKDAGNDFLSMCAQDVVFRFPFAPDGTVTEVHGLEKLTAYIRAVAGLIGFDSLSPPIVHPSQDGQTFTVEFTCKGHCRENQRPYDQSYISVIRCQNGKIVEYRDYWNPLILLSAVDGVDTLKSFLSEFIDD